LRSGLGVDQAAIQRRFLDGSAMWNELLPGQVQVITIADLRPTQVTVGMREVAVKRARWRDKDCESAARFMRKKPIPTIRGPGRRHYMIDGHHLARALTEECVKRWFTIVVADYSRLHEATFWAALECQSWSHPFDDAGRRVDYRKLPDSISDLVDDPYRSLAGALKRSGIYRKDKAPFSEFRWANFLRGRIERRVVDADFDRALRAAIELATGADAMALPGWCGAAPASRCEALEAA
jgi:hypothetical protein